LVLPPSLDRLASVISVNVRDVAGWADHWRSHPNKRAEALVLLADGHFLTFTQTAPIHILELGPVDDAPLGWRSSALLERGAVFNRPERQEVEFGVLAAKKLRGNLVSISDAALFDGQLFVVSGRGRVIARVELDDGPPRAELMGRIPSEIGSAEGLVLLVGRVPVVGVDRGGSGADLPNVYRLSALA